MNTKYKMLSIIMLGLMFTTRLYAQQSFVAEVNYAYLDKLIATAKQNYPQVKIQQSNVNIAQSTLTQTKVLWLDGITASYIYSPRNSINVITPNIFNGYQVSVSVNLGSLLSKPFNVRKAREGLNIAKLQQAQYELSIESQIKRLYFSYLGAQADLRVRSTAVVDGEIAVKQLKYSFQKGETTFQFYNDALTSLYNQNSFKVQAELSMLIAKANLEEVLGTKLEDVK
jgi:outer membrane protein TolC